jgi:acetoacetyl-CoA synthetase
VLGRFGFGFLATDFLVFPPLLHAASLLRAPGLVTAAAPAVLGRVDATDRTFIEDHAIYGCNAVLIGRDADYALVITKRRSLRGRPVSEIVYARNAERVVRSFERIKLEIMRWDRSIAVMADARILGPRPPRGVRRKRTRMYRSPHFTPDRIDNLYSEIVIR